MALVAPLKDGKFVTNASQDSLNKANSKNDSGMDSDAFLTLLVAEMQNQDPLEPTSNTEWISQYATFTEVSEIQAIGDSMQTMQADGLVGDYVIMKVTNENNGETNFVSGQVDYVVYEEGKAYLSIDGNLYSIDDLDTVASNEYMEAYELAGEIADDLKKLPKVELLSISDEKAVNRIVDKVDGMTTYQKKFLSEDVFKAVDSYRNTMENLVAARDAKKAAQASASQNSTSNNNSGDAEGSGTTIINNIVNNYYNTPETETDNNTDNENSESSNDISEETVEKLTSDTSSESSSSSESDSSSDSSSDTAEA